MTAPPKIYRSPRALSDAFARRTNDDPARGTALLMQRFAARVCEKIEGAVLKGGLGLELRLETLRTTKDADFIVSGSQDLDRRLAEAGLLDLGDFLKFAVRPDKSASTFVVPGMQYAGKRYIVQAYFADRDPLPNQTPVRKFKIEVSIGSAASFDVFSNQWKAFPQVQQADIRVYSIHWQLAEKVHAYTDPRHRDTQMGDRMRPRDLLDFCRCAVSSNVTMDAVALREALVSTFDRRRAAEPTLPGLPARLPDFPGNWAEAFAAAVAEASLPWSTPQRAHSVAAQLLDPVLAGTAVGQWHPTLQRWQ
jgi:hypothetical protein